MSNSAPHNGSSQPQDRSASQTPPYLTPNEALSSRPSSQSSSAHSRSSSLAEPDHIIPRSRSSSLRVDSNGHDDTVVMTSPPSMTLEFDEKTLTNGAYPQRYGSGQASVNRPNSRNAPRSASPAYRADVPHGIESGTDTDAENEADMSSSESYGRSPPAPPPKDVKQSLGILGADPDSSQLSESGDILEELGDPTAVERTSHATFIAPALPPIRFSMNTADFSELLSSVGGLPSLRSLDKLAISTKQAQEHPIPSTPPPTASSPTMYRHSGGSLADASSDTHVEIESVITTLTAKEFQVDQESTSGSLTPLPDSAFNPPSRRTETNNVMLQVREALNEAKKKGAQHVQVDMNLVDAILDLVGSQNADYQHLKTRLDGMNRESKLFIDGMTVAQAEYDQELKARRDAEAEVTRLRVLLSGQAARLTAMSGDSRKQELRQQFSKELNDNLSDLEQNLSRLKVERDVAIAEMEEISSKKSNGSPVDVAPPNLARSLTKRFETLRNQYQRELMPLTEQKEQLTREIAELKAVRDVFLEETTVLNARNEELAQLSAVYARRIENAPETPAKNMQETSSRNSSEAHANPHILIAPSLNSSVSGSSTVIYEGSDADTGLRVPRTENGLQTPAKPKFKWPGTRPKEMASPASTIETSKSKAHIEHNFQQLSVLRFARCDHCGEKMWGSQLRCTVCSTSIHVRCIANVQIPCSQHQPPPREEPQIPLPPSMFGRDLTEQVHADRRDDDRQVPVIVEKCIEAVEERALDYEGIYRKTGGSSQSKAITQMFERGDYDSFDLRDMDRFNDICSVTSVLKTYFRSLPVPLLTFDLHDQFMSAITIRDPALKQKTLIDLINMLPNEHYFTLRMLMLHLNQVRERCDKNLMNGRNLGVVFGPTLMRSRDPAAEFSDMAGKALFIEWLVDNAPLAFGSE
ncbi:hypothetical protein NLJ89_g2275 [Agrocybe chaxingu]|uniref:RhoGAP-domain-containing protein n=1 Tax=Agrocybe chaxingu TaxID=84603 RepID=A0A9W8MYS5_9AGAR|nr:hypothetical protein NLJ89_g2275 [Agrocybe chaxingu]